VLLDQKPYGIAVSRRRRLERHVIESGGKARQQLRTAGLGDVWIVAHRQLDRRFVVFMSQEQLLTALPHVGDSVEYKLILGGPCGPSDDICGTGWPSYTGPEYELTYRITRLPDVEREIVIAPPRR
jgi:hypothetical protein